MKNNTNNRTTTKTAAGFFLQANQGLQKGAQASIYSFRLLATAFLLLFSSTSFAYIGIESISKTCGTLCDGSIVVRTNGNAGPFEVSIQGFPAPFIFSNQYGTYYVFNDLCVGHYSIEVENAYMCVTTLETDVLEKESDILEEIDIQLSCICPGGFGAIAPVIEGAVSYNWTGPGGFESEARKSWDFLASRMPKLVGSYLRVIALGLKTCGRRWCSDDGDE